MTAELSEQDRIAYSLAGLFRSLGQKQGRDPLVLACSALLLSDPDGVRAWVEKQPPPPPPVID